MLRFESSSSLSCGSSLAVDRDELPREVTTLFELGLDSRIEFFVIRSDSSINHPTCSKFAIGEDVGLNALELAICRTSVRGLLDMCHNHRRVKK